MKAIILLATIVWLLIIGTAITFSQTVTDCPHPSGCVVLSAERARQALVDADTVKAQAAEILTLREAVVKQKEVTVDVKIELARTLGQLTGAQSELISLRAQIAFLMEHGRNKCGGFTLLCVQR